MDYSGDYDYHNSNHRSPYSNVHLAQGHHIQPDGYTVTWTYLDGTRDPQGYRSTEQVRTLIRLRQWIRKYPSLLRLPDGV